VATADFRGLSDVRQYWWLYLPLFAGLALWGVLDVIPRGTINWKRIHEHRTDFTVYTEAGAAFFDGRDPYQVSNPRGWHYLYPPLFAILVAPLHAIPSTWQVAVWFVLSVLMSVGCYFEMRRLADLLYWRTAGRERQTPLTWVGIAGLLAVLLPCFNCLQRGQVEVLKLYLLLVGFRVFVAARRPRDWFLAGVVFAAAGILKLTPLLPVACIILYDVVLSLTHRWDRWPRLRAGWLTAGVGSGLVLFALALPSSFIGWSANWHHLGTWFSGVVTKVIDVRTSDFGEDVRTVRNQSLDNSAYRFGNWIYARLADAPDDSIIDRPHPDTVLLPMDSPVAGEMIVLARIAGLALLLLFVVRAATRDQPLAQATAFGLACVATLVVCPVARGCYFALFLPAVVFVSMWLLRLGRPRTAVVLSVVPVAAIWLHYVAVAFTGRVGLLGLCTAAWFLCTCAILDRCLAIHRRRGEQISVKRAVPARSQILEPVGS
jgi:Glycosyltransferase family 87